MTLKISKEVTEPLLNTESSPTGPDHLRPLYKVIASCTIIASSLRRRHLPKKELGPQGLTLTTAEPQNEILTLIIIILLSKWKMQVITPKERPDSLRTVLTKPDSQPVPCHSSSG